VVAGLFVTGLWYYYFHMKPVSVTSGGSVPVITAPTEPAKVNPEPSTEPTGTDLAPASTAKKKIYDRILGEADAGGQMVPTEEPPSLIEPTPQPDTTNMLPEPVAPSGQTGLDNGSSAMPIPEPAGGQNAGETMPTPEPLPLPPTPGNDGTQGSISGPDTQALAAEVNNATRGSRTNGLSLAPEPGAIEPSAAAGESLAMAEANDSAAIDEQATPPSDEEPAAAAPEPEEIQPPKAKAKQKTATTKPKQPSAVEEAASSGQPLVLVAPEELPPAAAAESVLPSTQDVATTTTETTTGSSGLFGTGARKLTGKRAENAGSTAKTVSSSQQASTSAQDQVASIDTQQRTTSSALQPEPAPAPKEATTTNSSSSGGTGFVAQVASLRSEAEARAELDRLRGSYGNLIGSLSTRITKATVAGTTRYRLGFGPLPSRSQAAKLCSSLIAAGERDCAVRGL
jgi:cell division septation protein DedD